MGTRGAYGFHKNGVDKVTYNHFDSYFSGLGFNVVDFINSCTIKELNEIYDRIELIDGNIKPTQNQIAECEQWTDINVGSQSTSDWYCLLRKVQGDLSAFKSGLRYMVDSSQFMFDAVFNEYSYIINLDDNVLEIWCGFGKDEEAAKLTRYYTPNNDQILQGNESYWMRLVSTFPLDNIPEDWDSLCNKSLGYEDEVVT